MPVSACSVAVIKAKMNIFLWVMAPSLLLSSRVCSVCVYVRVRASFMHVSFMHLPKYCRFVHSCMSCDLWSCVVPVKTRYHRLSISAVTVKHYQKTRSKHWTHWYEVKIHPWAAVWEIPDPVCTVCTDAVQCAHGILVSVDVRTLLFF